MLRITIKGIRGGSLSASVVPVILGASIAWYHTGDISLTLFFLTLMGLISLQLGANLANDYFDYLSGVDRETQSISHRIDDKILSSFETKPDSIFYASLAFFALGSTIGLFLDYVSEGHTIILFGLIGVLAGFFYTAPPIKLSYRTAGEPFVFLAFGPLSVLGAYYIQTNTLSLAPFLLSIPIGFLVVAILYVHHFIHEEVDRKAGKITPIVKLGRNKALKIYYAMILIPFFLVPLYYLLKQEPFPSLLFLLTLPLAYKALRNASDNIENEEEFVKSIHMTHMLHFTGGLLLSLGFILGRF